MNQDNDYNNGPENWQDGSGDGQADPSSVQPGGQPYLPQDGQRYNVWNQQPDVWQNPVETEPPKKSVNNMATTSLIMGILGIVTACCCYGGLIFGSLGILFALLSKTEDHFTGLAMSGLITSIIALVLAPILSGIILAVFFSSLGDALYSLHSNGVLAAMTGGAF